MISNFLSCCPRFVARISPPRNGPFHIFFATFLLSVTKSASITTTAHTLHPSFITMSPHQNRRSTRLQKRSTTSDGNELQSSEHYNSMKVSELKDLLRDRGLGVSGVKSVLIERLTSSSTYEPSSTADEQSMPQPKAKRARKKSGVELTTPQAASVAVDCLPRTRELQLQSKHKDTNTKLFVIGVDEAGRGPLAGQVIFWFDALHLYSVFISNLILSCVYIRPVVAAAAIVPADIAAIIDSKKITKEEERERLYEELIASPDIRYAVAVVSAQRIDEINILQATLEGMRLATEAVMNMDKDKQPKGKKGASNVASAERKEISYVITGGTVDKSQRSCSYYTLIDGNKLPKDMPCECESLTKGDGREYSIGAASILAKVTRDRLMHEYSEKYPEYNLSQHKGYPTAAHMEAVKKFGASPIHRRTFAPLKHMKFDGDGKVVL